MLHQLDMHKSGVDKVPNSFTNIYIIKDSLIKL